MFDINEEQADDGYRAPMQFQQGKQSRFEKMNIEQLIGGGDDLLGAIVNHPNFANRFNEARIQRAAQRPVSIVSNLQQDEEEKNNGNQAQGGIVWWVWSTVKSVAWGIIEFVKYIFAKEDTSGMISGEEFKRIFSERLN